MEFIQVDDPFGSLDDPAPEFVALAVDQRLITECAGRPGGHAWTIQGDVGEPPWLECADCAAIGDDLYPDILDLLDGQIYELGGRTIVVGQELPDNDSSVFKIPVNVRIKEHRYTSMNSIGYEYDVEILITDRETAA